MELENKIDPELKELFKRGINKSIFEIQEILTVKSAEYWRNDNPFHNFETGAKMSGEYPEKVLYGFLLKHLVSLQDIINDLPKKRNVSQTIINEKINDVVIYMLILKELLYYNHAYEEYGY